jgi:hypothetical protein
VTLSFPDPARPDTEPDSLLVALLSPDRYDATDVTPAFRTYSTAAQADLTRD